MTEKLNEASNTVNIENESVRIEDGVVIVGGEPIQLLSGSVHYWRLDPVLWRGILQQCRALGFRVVCTYVPWSVHEVERGQFDYFGPRNLGHFLTIAAELGLFVLLRPGPHINAEITGFGFPERILRDADIKARGADGHPLTMPAPPQSFHIPSYSSSNLFDELELFFDSLKPIFTEHCYPRGPVIGVQADNENSYFFRNGPYDFDYHPEAVAQYREFVKARFEDLSAVNQAYGLTLKTWEALQPPSEPPLETGRQRLQLRHSLDWLEFKEHELRRGLKRVATALEERLPEPRPLLFHNYPPSDLLQTPFSVPEVEEFLDIQGFDTYPARTQSAHLKRQCASLVGASRLPFIPEFGAGSSPWNSIVRLRDQQFTAPYCLMNGIRGFNFYMLVERERWYGSPILASGEVRADHREFFEGFCRLVEQLDLARCRVESSVVLVVPRLYQRIWHACYLLDPVPPILLALAGQDMAMPVVEDDFGFDRSIAIEFQALVKEWINWLAAHNVPFKIVEGVETIAPEEREIVLCPAFEVFDEQLISQLGSWQKTGSHVFSGPVKPTLNGRLEKIDAGTEVLTDGWSDLKESRVPWQSEILAARPEVLRGFEPLQAMCQKRQNSSVQYLFLANCQADDVQVKCPEIFAKARYRKIYGALTVDNQDIIAPAYSVSVFEIPE